MKACFVTGKSMDKPITECALTFLGHFVFFLKKITFKRDCMTKSGGFASCCEVTSSNNRPNPRIPCQKSFSPRSRPVNSPGLERGCAQVPLKKINTSVSRYG